MRILTGLYYQDCWLVARDEYDPLRPAHTSESTCRGSGICHERHAIGKQDFDRVSRPFPDLSYYHIFRSGFRSRAPSWF